MPIHDWTCVPDGIFHHFHHAWIEEIARYLNHGHLPDGFYALAEQLTGKLGPDVLTLHPGAGGARPDPLRGGVTLAEKAPKVRYRARTQIERYAAKAKAVVIRHATGHEVIAMVEIVSSGNKSSQRRLDSFIRKAIEAMDGGIHLLIADLFPPTPRDPEGIHRLLWDDRSDGVVFDANKPLTCVAYLADEMPEAFVEPLAIGDALPEMPLFLTDDVYVPVPLETTYQSAWNELPAYWRDVVTKG